ncbi:TPA: hypothetical protein ACGR5Y_004548 [Escherichia coli]
MNINRLIFTIEDCLNTLSRFSVASSFVEYCDLRTVIGLDRQDRERRPWLNSPYIAATKRGEYLSVFEVSGAFREMDEASDQTGPGSLESLITSMSDSLNTAYKNSGHKISFVFERDPDMGKEEIEDMVAPQKRSLANTGNWPVMDTDPSTLRRVRRRSFSIIDNRNRKGYITRRYQCFPLAPLPEDRKYDSLPDLVLHPEQETIKCKEKHYSQPL